MIYKLQPSPIFRPRGAARRLPMALWKAPPMGLEPVSREEAKLFRWLVYDSGFELSRSHKRVNWNLVLGLVLAITISAGFWTGVGLLVAYNWK
jgi:hypothetical protein